MFIFQCKGFQPTCTVKHDVFPGIHRRHEREKKQSYKQRVLEVEYGSFTPIVLSAPRGMGKLATTTYNRFASWLAEKRHFILSMHWMAVVLYLFLPAGISNHVPERISRLWIHCRVFS